MNIGVLSDTHMYSLNDLPKKIVDELAHMDMIVHAGDYISPTVIDDLEEFGKFRGVYGNMDPVEVRNRLPRIDIFEEGRFKLGITHPAEGGPPSILEKKVRDALKGVDAIIYGHSHMTKNEVKNGVLFFNPGSATGQFTNCKSFGILNIGKTLKGRIIKL